MKTVTITYQEFLKIKAHHYAFSHIKSLVAKKLNIKVEDIDDIDWSFKLTFDVYLKKNM